MESGTRISISGYQRIRGQKTGLSEYQGNRISGDVPVIRYLIFWSPDVLLPGDLVS